MENWLRELHAEDPWMPTLLVIGAVSLIMLIVIAVANWLRERERGK